MWSEAATAPEGSTLAQVCDPSNRRARIRANRAAVKLRGEGPGRALHRVGTSVAKLADGKRLGADEFVVSRDADAMQKHAAASA